MTPNCHPHVIIRSDIIDRDVAKQNKIKKKNYFDFSKCKYS